MYISRVLLPIFAGLALAQVNGEGDQDNSPAVSSNVAGVGGISSAATTAMASACFNPCVFLTVSLASAAAAASPGSAMMSMSGMSTSASGAMASMTASSNSAMSTGGVSSDNGSGSDSGGAAPNAGAGTAIGTASSASAKQTGNAAVDLTPDLMGGVAAVLMVAAALA
ncbi:MAG: hypothetical protein Q9191_002180 [Dirinaria sp. TL-2023a]